ncbi:MAG: hypothetical protein DMF24_10890 [Verrucomicrobia bacterium]|nr:MAG: hypothetical protein DME90_07335 [Verrucomicrobiota bacterium]PYL60177.1 MAG: hypothetical protein DMF24_10890 [Verrucomicrobiota bacterium]
MKFPTKNEKLFAVAFALATICVANLNAQGGYDTPNKTDTFNAGRQVYHVEKKSPGGEKSVPSKKQPSRKAPTARLNRGEIVQVMTSSTSARPELAFYLPREATSIVQLVVEKRGSQRNFFLKGLSSGSTVGGAVQRDWLDASGYYPRNPADEARIQAAVKRNPLYIEVR